MNTTFYVKHGRNYDTYTIYHCEGDPHSIIKEMPDTHSNLKELEAVCLYLNALDLAARADATKAYDILRQEVDDLPDPEDYTYGFDDSAFAEALYDEIDYLKDCSFKDYDLLYRW